MESGWKKVGYQASCAHPIEQSTQRTCASDSTVRSSPTSASLPKRKADSGAPNQSPAESLLTQALRLANIGTWEYEVAARTFTWSDHFYRMLGLEPRNGPIRVEDSCEYIHPAQRMRMWQDVARLIESGEPLENEFSFVRPDGDVRVFHSRAVPECDVSGKVVRIRGMSQDITSQKRIEQDLHRLSQQLMQVRDQERRKTARDLHETVAQSLAALKMTLGRLAELLPNDNDAAQSLHHSLLVLAEETIQEIRTLSYVMHPPMLEAAGLSSTLAWFSEGFSRRSGIAVTLDADEDLGRFPQEVEISVFRIVQEALTNIHRHSGASNVEIRLVRNRDALLLQITDHGRGISKERFLRASQGSLGVGIAGMRERANQLHGTFEFHSAPARGTGLRVTFPIGKNQIRSENR